MVTINKNRRTILIYLSIPPLLYQYNKLLIIQIIMWLIETYNLTRIYFFSILSWVHFLVMQSGLVSLL